MKYRHVCFKKQATVPRLNKGWLLDAGAEQNHADAGDEEHDRNCGRDLHGLFFIQGSFVRSELGHFFLLVIGEVGMDQSNDSADQKNESKNDNEALHAAPKLSQLIVGPWRKQTKHTSAPNRRKEWQK